MKRIKKEESGNHIRMDRCQTEKKSRVQRRRRGRGIYALLKKDCRMMLDGKFFFIALGSLVLYTLFIRFGYLKFMNMEIYNIYLYDPAGTQTAVSSAVHPVSSREDMDGLLAKDAHGVGICVDAGVPILYSMRVRRRSTATGRITRSPSCIPAGRCGKRCRRRWERIARR